MADTTPNKIVALGDEAAATDKFPPLYAVSATKTVFISKKPMVVIGDEWNKQPLEDIDTGPARQKWSDHLEWQGNHTSFITSSLGAAPLGTGPVVTFEGDPTVFAEGGSVMREQMDLISDHSIVPTASGTGTGSPQPAHLKWKNGIVHINKIEKDWDVI